MENQTLEQAADKYIQENGRNSHTRSTFYAGAEWQKEQFNWVSVKDRLPDKSGRYLIWFPERSTSVMDAIWNVHDKTWGRDFDRTEYVTHWMHLPGPPQDTN